MIRSRALLALAVLTAAICVASAVADEEGVPSFKNNRNRETKEFVTRVGTAIIKAARSKPQKIELEKYEYTAPKENRTELHLKMVYYGALTKVKYNVEIIVLIDKSEPTRWEVLNIRYKDSNKSPLSYSEKKIQELIPKLNR